MFGEGMPWGLLLPIVFLAFFIGINAAKVERNRKKSNH